MRVGLDRNTGEVLTGWDECAQSIEVIATTAIKSLVLNRPFGSDIPDLIDKPGNSQAVTAFFTAIGRALRKWEPGFRLSNVKVLALGPDGIAQFQVSGIFYPNGQLGDYSNPQGQSVTLAPTGIVTAGA
ncbi:GPW/gp25 family protein [Rhodoblastus sp.]|uniref:GPW/gp25 family protein n=1 Tax=Rhodoblastus sp. TaxID=1962975 RepID=UPI003F9465DB